VTEKGLIAWRLDQAHLAVPVDLTLFSVDAAMRAAYKFSDRCTILLERDGEDPNRLLVFMVGRTASSDVTTLALDFRNELLDQQLRCRLEAQFKDVRTLIVAQAFSEGNLIDPDADAGNYQEDPRGADSHR
jgi:His-Xaa-Ser system protein HxsD